MYRTSCYSKQTKIYRTIQEAWNYCLSDSSCKGVHNTQCKSLFNFNLCYGKSKKSKSLISDCFYDASKGKSKPFNE